MIEIIVFVERIVRSRSWMYAQGYSTVIRQVSRVTAMSKNLVEASLSTPTARHKLTGGLHWRSIDTDVHLGYRKGVRAGRWLVRWRLANGRYRQEVIGSADDVLDADGVHTRTYHQASSRARELVQGRRTDLVGNSGQTLTVGDVVNEYLIDREKRELGRKRDARSRLGRYVLQDELSKKALQAVLASDLNAWRDQLPARLAPSTVRRLMNDLKAALNRAVRLYHDRLPASLPIAIRHGLASGVSMASTPRKAQALSDDKIRDIIHATERVDQIHGWGGDLLRLVLVLAATGARFSQISRLTVGDLLGNRLLVPTSRKGRALKQRQRVAVRLGPDVLKALGAMLVGRDADEPLLERWRWKQIAPAKWIKARRGPWQSASELTRPWASVRELAQVSDEIVPYALRHSSIVRCLRAALPVRYVASLHDTSTAMIEAHYSAFIVDAMDDLAGKAVVPLLASNMAPPVSVETRPFASSI
jgi:integrase